MQQLTACLEFLQRLIRTRSLPAHEGEIAGLVEKEMQRLGYDEVRRDEAGNVIGSIRGSGEAPSIMLNAHLDHVDVGDERAWPFPPFAGVVQEGRVWGRGAMDIKGPLATQIFAAAELKSSGRIPPGDVYVSAVVQEEVGGLGARYLATHLRPALVVVGEASRNQLRLGHRGRTELLLHVKGRSVHASVPHRGANPLHVVARFVQGLERLRMRSAPVLGASSVAPTLIRTDQTSPNVVPGEAWLTCDWRNTAGESGEEARQVLEALAEEALIPGTEAALTIPIHERISYTGFSMNVPADNPSFLLPGDHPALTAARRILREATGMAADPQPWSFATDGGHFSKAGLTVLGYAPGEEELAHTVDESIEIAQIEKALAGYRALMLELPRGLEDSRS